MGSIINTFYHFVDYILSDNVNRITRVVMQHLYESGILNYVESSPQNGVQTLTKGRVKRQVTNGLKDTTGQFDKQSNEADDHNQTNSDACILLLLPPTKSNSFESIECILKELFNEKLLVVFNEQSFPKSLNHEHFLAVILPPPTDDNELTVTKIRSCGSSPLIYFLQQQPITAKDKEVLSKNYPAFTAISNDPQELAVKVTLDVAFRCRILGDCYSRKNNKIDANKLYDQSINLLKRLNQFAIKTVGAAD